MAKRRKKLSFVVTFDQPDGSLVEDCRAYIVDAVSAWRGSLRPPGGYEPTDSGDPMWGLNSDTVKVRRYRP